MTNVNSDTHYDPETGAWKITGKASAMSLGPSRVSREKVFNTYRECLHILIATWFTGSRYMHRWSWRFRADGSQQSKRMRSNIQA